MVGAIGSERLDGFPRNPHLAGTMTYVVDAAPEDGAERRAAA